MRPKTKHQLGIDKIQTMRQWFVEKNKASSVDKKETKTVLHKFLSVYIKKLKKLKSFIKLWMTAFGLDTPFKLFKFCSLQKKYFAINCSGNHYESVILECSSFECFKAVVWNLVVYSMMRSAFFHCFSWNIEVGDISVVNEIVIPFGTKTLLECFVTFPVRKIIVLD